MIRFGAASKMLTVRATFVGILICGIFFVLSMFRQTEDVKRQHLWKTTMLREEEKHRNSQVSSEKLLGINQKDSKHYIGKAWKKLIDPQRKRKKTLVSNKQSGINFDIQRNVKVLETKSVLSVVQRDKIKYLKIPNIGRKRTCLTRKCFKETNWKMVIFVKSAMGNTLRRSQIRSTWGSVRSVGNGTFQVVFVVGKNNKLSQESLNKEHKKYQDILQIDAPDDYPNLVLKTLAGLQWASEKLRSDNFFSNADDDMLIDLWRLEAVVELYQEFTSQNSWLEFPVVCMYSLWDEPGIPFRNRDSKYYISEKRYKWPTWPKFCNGGMYTLSINVVRQIWEASRTSDIIFLEDVWTTGILREKIGMPVEMVVPAMPPVAKHYEGFKNGYTDENFIHDWHQMYNQSAHKPTCWCETNARNKSLPNNLS